MSESIEEYNARMNAQAADAWYRQNPGASMPHISQMIISKYISKGDVQNGPLIVTIRAVSLEAFGQGQNSEQRWILYFNEHAKGLKLNNTNLKMLGAGFGEDSDRWTGKKVKLWLDPSVQMAGQMVGGVRIALPRSGAALAPQGWPQGQGAPQVAPRFDPLTGQPLTPPQARFDPLTGRPLGSFDAATGEVLQSAVAATPVQASDPDFDDDIPF